MLAYCQKCGNQKYKAYSKCSVCGHNPPDTEDDLIRAVYLSTGRFEDDDDNSKYVPKLKALGEIIQNGGEIEYNEEEIERLREQKHLVESVRSIDLLVYLLRVFGLPMLLIGIILGVIFLLKYLKG